MKPLVPLAAFLAALVLTTGAAAHAPSVLEEQSTSAIDAVVLDDPTLSRAIGATIAEPGELDWYRLDLRAGDPLVVGVTAPAAEGAVATTFTLMGPGLPAATAAGPRAAELAAMAGVEGAIVFEPAADPPLERHGGLGFINYGTIRLDAPVDGSYYVAVQAVEPEATGKYVLAPGVREEFGLDAIEGMADLIGFFLAPWPEDGSA